jgi:hypothetical protein
MRALAALVLCGCLTSVHVIPREELMRLSSLPPEERGKQVRVIQGFTGADEPPDRAPPVYAQTVIFVPGPGDVGPRPGWGGRPSVKQMSNDSKFWIVVAAVTAAVLAVTEGMRFDGWVELHPMHPVHLWGPNGEWTWMPLAQIDPGTAAWARKAFVREEEGPWKRLARAPLDRVGFNYSLLFGSGEIPAFDGYKKAGFLTHIQLGYFPIQQVGIMLDIGLGWRGDERGAMTYNDVYQSRYALEIQVLPLDAGILHAGAYGQLGGGYRFEDFPDGGGYDHAIFVGGAGVIAQLELTTRLAFTVRGGAEYLSGTGAAEILAGLSIY